MSLHTRLGIVTGARRDGLSNCKQRVHPRCPTFARRMELERCSSSMHTHAHHNPSSHAPNRQDLLSFSRLGGDNSKPPARAPGLPGGKSSPPIFTLQGHRHPCAEVSPLSQEGPLTDRRIRHGLSLPTPFKGLASRLR